MAVRGHDQVDVVADLRTRNELGTGLHDDPDPRSPRSRRQPVFGIGHHDPGDLDTVLAQHIQCRHAEVAGADEGNPHDIVPSWGSFVAVDNTPGASVTPSAGKAAGYQQGANTTINSWF